MKIPTLLALILLSSLIILGIGIKPLAEQILPNKPNQTPQSITQSNLTPDSVTISWITNSNSLSKIIYTTDQNFLKDLKSVSSEDKKNQTLHLITLSELQPDTTYYFKIGEQFLFNKSNQFKTPPATDQTNLKAQPLIGNILDNNLKPISDALIFLEKADFIPLSTRSSQSGNFVLPIQPMYNKNNLNQTYDLIKNPEVTLFVSKDNLASRVNIKIGNTPSTLPPIILGENLDLLDYESTVSASIQENSYLSISSL